MKKLIIILIVFVCALTLFVIWLNAGDEKLGLTNEESSAVKPSEKPVIVLIIDSLMDKPLKKAVKEGRTPALQFFLENGRYEPEVVSAYPTMSVTIDSTLLTGTYPHVHRIPGLVWYNEKENRLVNYGSDKKEIAALGVKQTIKDGMYLLNHKHLNERAATIHEVLEKKGKQSASINGLIYRGDDQHDLNIPPPLRRLGLMPENMSINGPALFSFGRFAQLNSHNRYNHIWQSYGVNDKFTAEELSYLIKKRKLPALTVAYLPDFDRDAHKKGPSDMKGLEKMDEALQRMLNTYDSWSAAYEQAVWVIMGDSGQAVIGRDKDKAVIRLHSLFKNYRTAKIEGPRQKDQLLFGVNDRMAFIYVLDQNVSVKETVKELKKDGRIGFTAWKENGWVYADSKQAAKPLRFRPTGDYTDIYGQSWTISGDLSVLDLSANRTSLWYGNYPDALARLYSVLHSHSGRYVVADAKPGYQFAAEKSPLHLGGGGHGSLYKTDSLAPMIIVGSEKTPRHLRHIDLKDFFIQLTE
ncbi:alkaline phosphatase family protein [Bacillus swezeyi]|uniref:Phosphodiesterase n=1 Tax=Bacillus swezeyi TaxID=1925020 RepID=A0A1R1S2R1_9BACI|nr:alkaline phosphatase family protein [Bacillus swezeyi]MEC1261945.1 alkaline phosphatase family protein [Bacillus swezeyi]MED2930334.1 alkaline phosphatase family protein [Bacillus swezeyi]MED2944451.1 alkaline phosphatase family protein [Bacillus swezeyi]MED2966245.1 alkaline phosphatase family protein [Bacillus swezeyi]MED2976763.1 alkaline phosphatase family protein [Bacillus swezeyi]